MTERQKNQTPRPLPRIKEIRFRGKEHATMDDAFIELNFTGDRVISIGGRWFTIDLDELRRLQYAGIVPTTWHIHEKTGRVMSVPGKH
jgi:hypothetical protein